MINKQIPLVLMVILSIFILGIVVKPDFSKPKTLLENQCEIINILTDNGKVGQNAPLRKQPTSYKFYNEKYQSETFTALPLLDGKISDTPKLRTFEFNASELHAAISTQSQTLDFSVCLNLDDFNFKLVDITNQYTPHWRLSWPAISSDKKHAMIYAHYTCPMCGYAEYYLFEKVNSNWYLEGSRYAWHN